MQTHKIDIDEEVWRILKRHAIPLEDDPNAVLRRLLLKTEGNDNSKSTNMHVQGDLLFHTDIPHALAQILDVIYGVHQQGLSRRKATHKAAKSRDITTQSVIDKYTRQLGKHVHDIDILLRRENLDEFQNLLEIRFPDFRKVIADIFKLIKGIK